MGDEEAEREEMVDEEKSLEQKEQDEKQEMDEQPDLDLSKDQDAPGADVEKYTNLIRDYRHALEKLGHLINTLKSSISDEDKEEIEEQVVDARKNATAAKRRVDDYRASFGDATPPNEETRDALEEQYEIAMADTEEIAARRKQ